MPTGTALMAEPKKKKAGKDAPAIKTIGVKASIAYADWLEGLAEHQRVSVAAVIDRALAEHAESVGYKVPPPKRMP